SEADKKRNADNDKSNIWGERAFYSNCHRTGGDLEWFKDNLPVPADKITPAWTFAGKWDPESTEGPRIIHVEPKVNHVVIQFSEAVTVKGKPKLAVSDAGASDYESGSGSDTLTFKLPAGYQGALSEIDLNGGAIIASKASAAVRPAVVKAKSN